MIKLKRKYSLEAFGKRYEMLEIEVEAENIEDAAHMINDAFTRYAELLTKKEIT